MCYFSSRYGALWLPNMICIICYSGVTGFLMFLVWIPLWGIILKFHALSFHGIQAITNMHVATMIFQLSIHAQFAMTKILTMLVCCHYDICDYNAVWVAWFWLSYNKSVLASTATYLSLCHWQSDQWWTWPDEQQKIVISQPKWLPGC